MEASMSKLPREESPEDAPPRAKARLFRDGLRIENRYSLGALVLGVFACGLCYAIAYVPQSSGGIAEMAGCALMALAVMGSAGAIRAHRRRAPWLGSAVLIFLLALLGFGAGTAHTSFVLLYGPDSYMKRFDEVHHALERFGKDRGRYPEKLSELAPIYLSGERVNGMQGLLGYRPASGLALEADLDLRIRHGVISISIVGSLPALPPPPVVVPSPPAAAAPADAAE